MSKNKQHKKRGKHATAIVLLAMACMITSAIAGMSIWSASTDGRPDNTAFLAGRVPQPSLDGFYKGNHQNGGTWQGKKFDAAAQRGINVFGSSEKYSFATSNQRSLSGGPDVLRLDYNQDGNPWWIRLITDEIAQTPNGKLQGKVYLRLGPLTLTMTYFELQK